jgi:hypothetical protein
MLLLDDERSTKMDGDRLYPEGKTVFVREYLRFRLGAWETVVSHFRRPPCR